MSTRSASLLLRLFLLLAVATNVGRKLDPMEKLEAFIRRQEKEVERIAEAATEWHTDRIRAVRDCECSKHACSNDFVDSECVHHLGEIDFCKSEGRRMDYNASIFRTPPGTSPTILSDGLKESICVYKRLEDISIEYGRDEPGWLYIGTRDGHFRRIPGSADLRGEEDGDERWGFCEEYDPRRRPWFIGASTGPKDIVLIVDKSGSMTDFVGFSNTTKWDLVVDAVTDVIDTFTFSDYVSLATFSDEADTVLQRSGLVKGQAENLELLKEALRKEKPKGKTNFTAAFRVAFPLLWERCGEEPAECSNCEKIILFLTDGRDLSGEDGESISSSDMLATVQGLQERLQEETGKRAAIFTYSLSNEADDAIPRQIACANDGAWSFIGPYTNTLDALNSYYLYAAAERRVESPIWIEPYEDASGLGTVATVAAPFYARGTKDVPDVFLGVVGHDVPLWELEFDELTRLEVFAAIFDRSSRCTIADTTPCELQVYRNAHDKKALCPDTYPVVSKGQANSDAKESDIQCYAFGDRYYRRSPEKVKWSEAVSRCEDAGGQLASVESEEEIAFLANLASHDGTWIGAERTKTGSFAWLNASLPKLQEDSEYWGVQEPISVHGTENCAAIDTRGVTANLKAIPCNRRVTYVCKFETDAPCLAGVADIPRDGFFKVPPLDRCVDEIEALDETRPVKDVKKLSVEDVMCDLGKERTNKERICCTVDEDDVCQAGKGSSSKKDCR